MAGGTSISDAEELFGSKDFTAWKKAREAEAKLKVDVIDRLNHVIGAIYKTARRR